MTSIRDARLTKLVQAHLAGDPLPTHVTVGGTRMGVQAFLNGFTTDSREAWPAIAQAVEDRIERPLVSEVAGALA